MRRITLVLILALAACGGGGTGPGPGPGGVGTFTAVIDGQGFVSTTNQSAGGGSGSQIPGLVTLTGTKIISATNYTTVSLYLAYLAGPGTYPLGVNQASTAGGGGTVSIIAGSTFNIWSTAFPGNAGTVTITSMSATRIVGTFQFNAPPQLGSTATGTKVVTGGAFDMPLPAGFTPATASNKGSKVTATIGGTAWNAATIVSLGATNFFGLGATSDSYSINITPGSTVSAGNTYPIGGPSPGGTMTASRTGTSQSWNSVSSTPVGSITVTSFSGGRAVGTFSATLAGTSGALVVANGTFDVRVTSQ